MQNKRHKILLIEDDKIDELAFKWLVENEKLAYDYVVASSVSQAKSKLSSEQFDVVISDYLLPDGTAFDILNIAKHTPVVIITAAGSEEIAVKAMKAGACDYLIKDLNRNYLKTVPITIENVIKQKKLEEVLHRKQKNLEAIFDAVPVGMLLVDENIIVRRVNDAIRQMVGRGYSEIINRRVGGVLCCVNSVLDEKGCGYSPACNVCPLRKMVEDVLDSGQSVHAVEIHPTLKIDNKEITPWLSISAEPTIIDGFKRVVVAIEDITDRKRAEEKLKETMELKSQFISTVSHELRTPLASLKEGVTIVLEQVAGKINDKQRDFLDIAKRNIDRLAEMINDVLDFQKFEAGKMQLNVQENDIKDIVGQVHKTMAPSAKKRQIDFSVKLEDNLPGARFDNDKIIQVLINLVSNAISFTPEHGKISICVQHQDQDLVIRVSDTGMGIPKDDLPKIFERFYRVHRSGKQNPGTGLGLAIVNKIVMMHGGRIEVESELEQGTTFTVFLPLAGTSVPEVVHEKKDDVLVNN